MTSQVGQDDILLERAVGPQKEQKWDADAGCYGERWSIPKPAPWPLTSRATSPVPLLTDRLVASVKNAKAMKKYNIPTLKGLPYKDS